MLKPEPEEANPPPSISRVELSLSEPSPCILLIVRVVKYLWVNDGMIFEISFQLMRDGAQEGMGL